MNNKYLYILLCSSIGFSQVGIGTTNPQEELHLTGTTSTIRIEGLSTANNPLNDGVKNARVYVTGNGNLTLTPPSYVAGGSGNGNLPINFLIDVPNFIPDNIDGLPAPYDSLGRIINSDLTQETVEGFIYSVTFTVPAACTVEVKHGVTLVVSGINMLIPPRLAYINDSKTRTIQTYFCFDINNDGLSVAEKAIQYGNKGQFYCSVAGGSLGYPYMNSQGYATLPPGTHSIHFFGIVQDSPNTFTSVGFGGATDYLKLRVYN
ncbi:hypothetical protein [Flavobacterium proteolyticum]|uniref:Uncharacterized protein n=1 Tax=Flavobacterium proteolyticum TaxID=2911683 RepID=A0ABR9WSW7_9FLAO|nr:hypothetical protein [Flavobacterium proteolyticum]MBE9575679.1 hypothetical protein [Flavobacterium proteolyticum]